MRRSIEETLDSRLSAIPLKEKMKQIAILRDLLFSHEADAILESAKPPKQEQIPFCSECGSVHVNKFGKRGGKQRFRCVDCKRTFTEATRRSVIGSSKLDRGTWMRYINYFIDELPLSKIAKNCGISLPTAYTMRLRILSLIADTEKSWHLEADCKAQLDETYVHESFKGNRSQCKNFTMPRPAYKRGRKNDRAKRATQGVYSADQICVITGVNERRETFFEIVDRGQMGSRACKTALVPKLSPGSFVTTDEQNSYIGVLRGLKVNHASFPSAEAGGKLNSVNSLHSHFKAFLSKKRSVSTRRLPLYMAEFSWRWGMCMNDDSTALTASKIIKKIANTDFTRRIKDFQTSEYPCFDWWLGTGGKKETVRRELDTIQRNISYSRKKAVLCPGALFIVEERQKALDKRIAAAKVNILGSKASVKHEKNPESSVPMSIGLLKTNSTSA